jgi:hypothetical protein
MVGEELKGKTYKSTSTFLIMDLLQKILAPLVFMQIG